MIESVGYTDDGKVWLKMVFEVEKKPMQGVLSIPPEVAQELSDNIAKAVVGAKENLNGRDSKHVN